MQNPFNPTFEDVPQIYLDNNNRAQQLATDIQQSRCPFNSHYRHSWLRKNNITN